MLTINIAILLPFIAAAIILIFFRRFRRFHIGWLVLIVPTILFIQLVRQIRLLKMEKPLYMKQVGFLPMISILFLILMD